MICYAASRPSGLLMGTIVAIAMLLAPAASAHIVHHHHTAVHASTRHNPAGVHRHSAMRTSHRVHRMIAMGSPGRASPWRHERIYGQQQSERGMMQARYEPFTAYRKRLVAEDEREAPITARLNLEQLQIGRERDAEIAQWQSQYGSAGNRS